MSTSPGGPAYGSDIRDVAPRPSLSYDTKPYSYDQHTSFSASQPQHPNPPMTSNLSTIPNRQPESSGSGDYFEQRVHNSLDQAPFVGVSQRSGFQRQTQYSDGQLTHASGHPSPVDSYVHPSYNPSKAASAGRMHLPHSPPQSQFADVSSKVGPRSAAWSQAPFTIPEWSPATSSETMSRSNSVVVCYCRDAYSVDDQAGIFICNSCRRLFHTTCCRSIPTNDRKGWACWECTTSGTGSPIPRSQPPLASPSRPNVTPNKQRAHSNKEDLPPPKSRKANETHVTHIVSLRNSKRHERSNNNK